MIEFSRNRSSYINFTQSSQSFFIIVFIVLIFRNSSLVRFYLLRCVSLSINATMPSRYPGAVTQDWEPVVLHKSKQKSHDLRDPKAVNAALRSGVAVQTVKKFDAGSNKKGKSTAAAVINTKKLEEETEPSAIDRVRTEVRVTIQKARLEKKMSQADLAKQINERTQVVQEYENGKAVPNQAVLAKMEKVLGVKLRGKIVK